MEQRMMKTAFHYAVKIKLFNYHSKYKVEYIEHFEEFRNENPIEVKIAAFRCFQNWVEGILFLPTSNTYLFIAMLYSLTSSRFIKSVNS